MLQRSILVCDHDPDFLGSLTSKPLPYVHFLTARTPIDAQHIVANRQNRIAAICINPALNENNPVPLIRFCRAHRPATPISLLADNEGFPAASLDLAALHVQKVHFKPLDAPGLASKLIPVTVFELDKAIELAKKDSTAAGDTAEHEDDDMHAIEAESFLCGSVSYFDVFVKLSQKKYVKILKAKDAFDAERVGSYLRKGVRHFYIRKEAQVFFLQYCDKLTEAVLAKKELPAEVKLQQLENLGRETANALKRMGLSEASVHSAAKFVNYSHKLVRVLDLKKASSIGPFLDQLKGSDHGAGTSMLVALLLDALGFKDEDVKSVIALGAFLHDVGLLMLPGGLGEKEYASLSDEEKREYEKHPNLGADAVAAIPQINPLVVQIIRQHHERRDRRGYPAKLGPGAIAPMAEIVGIAALFQELITRSAKDSSVDPLLVMEQEYLDKFSFQTVEGFRKAFLSGSKS